MTAKMVYFTAKTGEPIPETVAVLADSELSSVKLSETGDYSLYYGRAEIAGDIATIKASSITIIGCVGFTTEPIVDSAPIPTKTSNVDSNWDALTDLLRYLYRTLGHDFGVLKGGYMLASRQISQRGTVDVDLDLFSKAQYARLRDALIAYGENLKHTGLLSDYRVVDEITDISGGAKFYVDGKVAFSIDVSDGAASHINGPAEIPGIGEVLCETLESVVADKMSVVFSPRRFRRVKDLFDLHFLSKNATLNLTDIRGVLRSSGKWPLNPEEYPFTDANLQKLQHAWDRFKVRELSPKLLQDLPDAASAIEKPSLADITQSVLPLIQSISDESKTIWEMGDVQ